MTSECPQPWEVELRRQLRQHGDGVVVDVEAGLQAVDERTNRKRQRRHTRRSLGTVLATSAAVASLVLVGRPLLLQPSQTPLTSTDGNHNALSDGIYRYRLTARDLRAASPGYVSRQVIKNNAGIWTWKLHNGHWNLRLRPTSQAAEPSYQCTGKITLNGDLATFVRTVNGNPVGDCAPPSWSARYRVQGRVVQWAAVSVPDFSSFFAPKPWIRR